MRLCGRGYTSLCASLCLYVHLCKLVSLFFHIYVPGIHGHVVMKLLLFIIFFIFFYSAPNRQMTFQIRASI